MQNGRKELAWSMQHRDPLLCGIGAILRHLLWHFEFVDDKKYPNFESRQAW